MRVILSPEALRDLEETLAYIAQDSAMNAANYVAGLREKAMSLGRFPRRFRTREGLPSGIRVVPHVSHVILFRIGDDTIDVVRVVHGARNLPGLFGK